MCAYKYEHISFFLFFFTSAAERLKMEKILKIKKKRKT